MVDRIVILRAGALGDTVLSLPALHALRACHPRASIEVVGYPDAWQVAGSLVDSVRSIDAPLFTGLSSPSPSPELRVWLEHVDLVVAWTTRDYRPVLAAAGIPQVVWTTPYPPPDTHAAGWLLQSVTGKAPFDLKSWRLELQPGEIEQARDTLRHLGRSSPSFIHPGAGATWKRWPANRFAALANELAEHGHQVALIEGPADGEAVVAVQHYARSPFPVVRASALQDSTKIRVPSPLPAVHPASVPQLASLLACGALFVGNDSGVTHLAAAVGLPVVALFGPTDPTCWASLGQTRVLRSCQTRTARQGQIRVCEDPACMERIALGEVLQACDG